MLKWLICAGLLILIGLFAAQQINGPSNMPEARAQQDSPTYYSDIQPILQANCLACHVEGGIAPFALDSAEAAQAKADQIAAVTLAGIMPPWMPGPDSPPMQYELKLTPDEIDLLAAWAEAGAPLGNPAASSEPQMAPLPTDVRPDLVISLPEPYTPDDTLQDDYRCFRIETGLTEDRMITGFTVEPGQKALVHHVLLFKVPGSIRQEAITLDAADDRPGWQCYGGPNLPGQESRGLEAVIGGWTPGSVSGLFPEGSGYLLEADSFLVLQVHYNLHEQPQPDQTEAVFQFAPTEQPVEALSNLTLYAPVEIPCSPTNADSPACDRAAALNQAADAYGSRVLFRANYMLDRCQKTEDDYIYQDASRVTSDCDLPVQRDTLAIAAAGHMHTRGQSVRIERNPGTSGAQVLLDIPAWDFHWQGAYLFQDPIPLHAGDVLRITCSWANQDARYIVWGEGTMDEMCLGLVVTRSAP